MSTLSSWIDPDEISELMPFLVPETPATGDADDLEETPVPGEEIETPIEISAEEEDLGPSFSESEIVSADHESDEEPETDSSVDPEAGIDFNSPEAYDAAAFPESGGALDDTAIPARQAAAVQAAVTLERARDRASEVGLLKNGSPDAAAAEPDFSDPSDHDSPSDTEVESVPGPETLDEPDPVETVAAEAPEVEPAAVEESAAEPGTFRDRLARFADSAAQLTSGSDPIISDFQSYPLYQSAGSLPVGHPRTVDSIVRMNRMISRLPDQPNGDSERTSQIALSENAQWLCVLTQGCASGGVCFSLRIPGPISTETAGKLHSGLRAALTGPQS